MADRPRVVFEDPDLPHQIVIALRSGGPGIAVSCNCLRARENGHRGQYEVLEVRTRWDAAGALAVWRAHVAEVETAATGGAA